MTPLQALAALPSIVEAGGKTFRRIGRYRDEYAILNREEVSGGRVSRLVTFNDTYDPVAEVTYVTHRRKVMSVRLDRNFANAARAAEAAAGVAFEWREAFGIRWLVASTGDALAALDSGARLRVSCSGRRRFRFSWYCGSRHGDATTVDRAMGAAVRAYRSPRSGPREWW